MENKSIVISKKEECCGCSACFSICPTKAISMNEDGEGFQYPTVSSDKCINCGLCTAVCPLKKNPDLVNKQEYYAVKNTDDICRKESTSGGVFSLLAEYILQNSGVIYGADFDENFEVHHRRDTGDNWYRFKGAKYVQSDMKSVFEEVGVDLEKSLFVMFTGTPCQVAGLKEYLNKKKISMEKLLTCDLVCHGVPSPKIWRDYLQNICNIQEVGSVSFRSKESGGWHDSRLLIANRDKEVIREIKQGKGTYLSAFSNNVSLRPSCYECKYTNFDRVGDFTLGDFWGIEKTKPEIDDNKGISLLMVNSEKASRIWSQISDKADVVQMNKEECIQPNLVSPSQPYGDRELFWRVYTKHGLEAACKMMGYTEVSGLTRMSYTIYRKCIRVVDKLSSIIK